MRSGKSEEGGKIDGKRGNESWKKNECGEMMDTLRGRGVFFFVFLTSKCFMSPTDR